MSGPPDHVPDFRDRAAMAAAALQRLSEGRFPQEDIPYLRIALQQLLDDLLPASSAWAHRHLQTALAKTAGTTRST